jgi:hypothetical protein
MERIGAVSIRLNLWIDGYPVQQWGHGGDTNLGQASRPLLRERWIADEASPRECDQDCPLWVPPPSRALVLRDQHGRRWDQHHVLQHRISHGGSDTRAEQSGSLAQSVFRAGRQTLERRRGTRRSRRPDQHRTGPATGNTQSELRGLPVRASAPAPCARGDVSSGP